MAPLDRRGFLAGAGAAVVAPRITLPSSRSAAVSPFGWGVASFDPTDDGVLLWTRVDPSHGAADLAWVVARDEALAEVVAAGEVEVGPGADHCATVEVTGLEPGGVWWYGFHTREGAASPVGRTRTMPTGQAERLRFGVVSCSRFAAGGFAAYRTLAEREVDLVVHLGDYIYEDGASGSRAHEPAEELRSLDQYRARYAQHRGDPDLQALHARHPMVAVWDDHEVAGNAWRDGAAGHDPATEGPWLDRLRAAGQAHAEWVPGRTEVGSDGRLRAWRSLALGELAELVVLDTRTWGRDQQPVSPGELTDASGRARSLLGDDQARFVAERLARRGADGTRWTVLANQVMLHPLRVPALGASSTAALEAAGFLVADGTGVNPDQWDGYPGARDELLAGLGDAGGVVVLTGDVHSSWAWEGPAGADGRPACVELITPSVSAAALAERLPFPAALAEVGLAGLDADLSYVELSSHGYLLVELTPKQVRGEWWHVDPDQAGPARFAAARVAPHDAPMHLTADDAPLPDPPPPTTTATAAAPTTTAPSGPGEGSGRAFPVPRVGLAAAALAAVAATAVALRRRR